MAPALESAALESDELSPGTQLGNYVVQACIGRGAMASVYRAEHCLLNKQVALKVMAPGLHSSPEARQRFLREARAVAAIQHPNVVAIADAGLVDGVPYLVMELLEGEDLEQHLERQGPFSGRELAALALPLVAALAAAHDAGVIHRDLKPGNIFLARGPAGELVPKLLDFGISKFASPAGAVNLAMTAFDQLMGSPLYLPPEALQGSRELTPRSDQYSLGVVLYECITGQAPFFREDLVPLLNAISEGSCAAPRSLRPETPEALNTLILRAMSVDPRRRFEHIRDLGRALLSLADLRTRHIWAPAFGSSDVDSEAAVVVAAGALAAAADVAPAAPVRVRSPRRAVVVKKSRRRRVWSALALLVSGSALLALALGRAHAVGVVVEPSVVMLEALPHEGLPPVLTVEARVTQAPPAADRAPDPEAAAGSAAGAGPALASRALAAPQSLGSDAAAPSRLLAQRAAVQVRPLRGERSPAPRAASQRPRDSDSDTELSRLFFSGAAAEAGKSQRPRREREAKALEESPVLVNEAPLLD